MCSVLTVLVENSPAHPHLRLSFFLPGPPWCCVVSVIHSPGLQVSVRPGLTLQNPQSLLFVSCRSSRGLGQGYPEACGIPSCAVQLRRAVPRRSFLNITPEAPRGTDGMRIGREEREGGGSACCVSVGKRASVCNPDAHAVGMKVSCLPASVQTLGSLRGGIQGPQCS